MHIFRVGSPTSRRTRYQRSPTGARVGGVVKIFRRSRFGRSKREGQPDAAPRFAVRSCQLQQRPTMKPTKPPSCRRSRLQSRRTGGGGGGDEKNFLVRPISPNPNKATFVWWIVWWIVPRCFPLLFLAIFATPQKFISLNVYGGFVLVGYSGFEPLTSSMSRKRSNQLS